MSEENKEGVQESVNDSLEDVANDNQSESQESKIQNSIPYERFQKKVAELKELESKMESMRKKVEDFDSLSEQFENLKKNNEEQLAQFDSFKQIASALGTIDEEAIETAKWNYGRIEVEEGSQKPSIGEWISSIKENPDSAPRSMQAFFTDNKVVEAPMKPNTKINSSSPPAANGKPTVESLRKARIEARKSGDYSQVRALREALRNS